MIRPSSPDEADAVADVFLAARADSAEAGRIPAIVGTEQAARAFIRRQYDEAVMSVWDDEGAVVALLITSPGWIEHLYVAPTHTGRGIGSALVDHAKKQASGPLELWTFQANDGARRFYERHGFEAVEFTDGSTNMERSPDVRYVWRPA